MTVVDFRSSGGFEGSQPNRLSQDYPYAQDAQQDDQDEWQENAGWDDHYAHAAIEAEPQTLFGRITRLTHYVGALVSVGLIVILAVWGFKLVVRDVSGVPVIRAIQGEARTAPENPGGELTERTGLAVNNVAAGRDAGQVDRVAIAPQATGLGAQDLPMGELGASAQEPSHKVELPLADDSARVIALPDGEAAKQAANAVETALITDAPAAEAAVNEVVTDLAGNEAREVAINTALAEAAVQTNAQTAPPAVAQSTRPAPRPRRIASAAPVATSDAAPSAAPNASVATAPETRPETPPAAAPTAPVASGSSLVQIGAFDSEKLATGEWNRISGKFGALFSGKGMVIQKHETNGRAFWRLRAAGFGSKDDARRFCAALIAEGIDCIPATAK